MVTIKQISPHETYAIRQQVLWPSKSIEALAVTGDETALHLGALHMTSLVGVGSFFYEGTSVRLRKLAVLPDFQGQGIGQRLIETAIEKLAQTSARELWCDARETALPFYEKLGFSVSGDIFHKDGLPYFKAHKNFM
ncbi:GNAT family N-acetyltransferase [Flexibacterium corallicola]|uniref:GNAT family N-acetyltransferase n=1 Tax=Flexibacterium corallicola TaxID=3037259 RepID=UPI00286ECAC8|nr:GNAT family N-acetyltransferase [Pseudovibrio sp. M1P-2-3]